MTENFKKFCNFLGIVGYSLRYHATGRPYFVKTTNLLNAFPKHLSLVQAVQFVDNLYKGGCRVLVHGGRDVYLRESGKEIVNFYVSLQFLAYLREAGLVDEPIYVGFSWNRKTKTLKEDRYVD